MFFYMPAKVYCENNCVRAHAKELASFGKKALIVTGKSSAFKNGSIADVQAALSDHGVECAVFNEVEENPSVETVMKGRDRGLAEGADFVIGIGGGSPMDAAKAIALMIRQKDAGVEYLYDSSAVTDALPVVCIPTTCGTGSEVTAVSVLSRPSLRAKGSIPPPPEESSSTHPSTPSPICMRVISTPRQTTAAACVWTQVSRSGAAAAKQS